MSSGAPPRPSSSRSPSAVASARCMTWTCCSGPGADKVAINTGAIRRPEVIAEITRQFGNQVLVLSVDARRVVGPAVGLRGHHPRRPQERRPRRRRLGPARRRARGGGDPAQLDGRRRHHRRLRPGHDRRRPGGGRRTADRLRRRRPGRGLPARGRRRRRCRAGGQCLPLRHGPDRRGEGRPRGRRLPGPDRDGRSSARAVYVPTPCSGPGDWPGCRTPTVPRPSVVWAASPTGSTSTATTRAGDAPGLHRATSTSMSSRT